MVDVRNTINTKRDTGSGHFQTSLGQIWICEYSCTISTCDQYPNTILSDFIVKFHANACNGLEPSYIMFFAIIQHDTSIVELHYDVTFGCIDAVLRTTVSFTTFLPFFLRKRNWLWCKESHLSTNHSLKHAQVHTIRRTDRPQVATPWCHP